MLARVHKRGPTRISGLFEDKVTSGRNIEMNEMTHQWKAMSA